MKIIQNKLDISIGSGCGIVRRDRSMVVYKKGLREKESLLELYELHIIVREEVSWHNVVAVVVVVVVG